MRRLFLLWPVLLLSLGCEAPGVGDPCEPEDIPDDGFKESEVYLETRSLQCRTRVCMVNHLRGDPRVENPTDDLYVSEETLQQRVYCTCKCDAEDQDTIRCESCPDGFECCPAFTIGPPGLRGSYCVRKGTCINNEGE